MNGSISPASKARSEDRPTYIFRSSQKSKLATKNDGIIKIPNGISDSKIMLNENVVRNTNFFSFVLNRLYAPYINSNTNGGAKMLFAANIEIPTKYGDTVTTSKKSKAM